MTTAQEQDVTAPPDDLVANVVVNAMAARIATLTAENKALRIALRNLRNQVAGSFDAFESELRPVIGNTNYACVMEAIAKADAADSGCLAAGAANER